MPVEWVSDTAVDYDAVYDRRNKQELLKELKQRDIDIAYYTPTVCRLEVDVANKELELERQTQAHNTKFIIPLEAKIADLESKLNTQTAIVKSQSTQTEKLYNITKTQSEQLTAAEERCLQLATALDNMQQQLNNANAALEQERIRTARFKIIHDIKKEEAKRFKKAKAAIRAQRMEELRFT